MKVTFDSNTYRRVTEPTFFSRDPDIQAYEAVHEAVKDGRIQPFLSETVATLEGVQNSKRGAFFASTKPHIETAEQALSDGRIGISFKMGADNSLHPGVPPAAERWLKKAIEVGFKFLRAPRIGQPRPTILMTSDVFAPESDQQDRLDLFHDAGREIEERGVGIATAKAVGNRINLRNGSADAWFEALGHTNDVHEEREMQRSVSEWADGDTVAAHIGYGCDVLCTQDEGKSSGPSIFSPTNRAWLQTTYGVDLATLAELARRI